MPIWQRDSDAEYRECHIDGAVRFDFRKVRDKTHAMPLMLPSAEQFEKQVGEVRPPSLIFRSSLAHHLEL